jgi:hypothetical protein
MDENPERNDVPGAENEEANDEQVGSEDAELRDNASAPNDTAVEVDDVQVVHDNASAPEVKEAAAAVEPLTAVEPLPAPLDKVYLVQHESENLHQSVWATINEKNQLVVEGLDYGPLVEDMLFCEDYEYSVTIDAQWKDTMLLLLLKERFHDFPPVKKWLKDNGIPHGQFSWY